MPLEIYARGPVWWVRGRVELNGRPVTDYYRCSTGASDEAGARDWVRAEEERAIRRHLLGDEAGLTFAEAVILYPAKPAEAKFLLRIVPEIGTLFCAHITPQMVRDLAPRLYPDAATDTWKRQVASPVSAVINNAHQLGRCPPIRIKGWTSAERIAQDQARGKLSRQPKTPGDWPWLQAFCGKADPYNAALAEFMFETGARVGQAVALRPADLDLQRARVRLPASKGHPTQWIAISMEMVVRLANLPARAPVDKKNGRTLTKRVFGYATKGGMHDTWKTICKAAGIDYRPPHSAGRHGFYTELRVRQGLDPITAAAAGRWSNPSLPDRVYAHADLPDAEIRARIRTGAVQPKSAGQVKALK